MSGARRGIDAGLVRAAAFSVRRPWTVLLAATLAVVAALAWAAHALELRTSNLDLVDADLPPVRAFTAFAEAFGTPNVLIVVLESDDPAALAAAADRAGAVIRKGHGVRGVVDRVPLDDETLASLGLQPHLLSDDGRMAFVLVQPDDPHSAADTIAPFVEGVQASLDAARLGDLGVKAGLTGMPKYALDDRDVIQRDISVLSAVASVLVLLLFIATMASPLRPVLAMTSLLAAVAVMLGLIAVYPGHLTLLSASFASMLVGMGDDFAMHLLGRVEELVTEGLTEAQAIPAAVASLGRGMVTAALTVAAGFYTMAFSGFRGFAELGLIAGTGILACAASVLVVLPALVMVVRPKLRRSRPHADSRITRILLSLQRPAVTWGVALASLACVLVAPPAFDGNYLNLQPRDSETVRLERAMVEHSDMSPYFAAFVTSSKEEALALSERLLSEQTVGEVTSIADLDELGADPAALAAYRTAFESPDGRFAVYAYPKGDMWDAAEQARFIDAMEAIDPNVTGMPFLGRFMIDRSRRALRITTALASLLVAGCVALDFRRAAPTFVALLPAFLTVFVLHALMRLCGLAYNPLDVMALPIVIGIAVDNGVHVLHRFIEERGDLARTLAGTGRNVVMSSATTIAAFGCIALTSHRGLASFALALTLGVAAALVLSLLLLPGLLHWLRPRILAGEALPAAGTPGVPA